MIFVKTFSILNSLVAAKFQGYMYGGRPLGVSSCSFQSIESDSKSGVGYNDKWHEFTNTAAKGGSVVPIVTDQSELNG